MDNTRRQLISLMLGSGIGMLTPPAWSIRPRQRKVIVIGAGFAGVGAAKHLLSAGYHVEIIEAQERVGGRAQSIKYGNSILELGAAWLNKGVLNPLHTLSQKNRVPIRPIDFSDVWVSTYADEGHFTHPLKIDNYSLEGIERSLIIPYLQWQAAALMRSNAPRINMTILNKYLQRMDPSLSCVVKNLYKVSNGAELNQLHVLNELKAAGNDPYGVIVGKNMGIHNQDYLFMDGMQGFVETLAKDIPLSLNEAVKVIDWSRPQVLVQTNQRIIEADAVIVTSSIGLLKANKIHFKPRMPSDMRRALKGMEMGSVNKIILTFPNGNWSLKQPSIHFCNANSPVNFAINSKVTRGENYFTGIAGANKAKQLETRSDDELAHVFKKDLEQAMGQALPDPTDVFITRWNQHPWSLGSYSMMNMNVSGYEKLILRKPMGGKVFLAGEGLSIRQATTVNGAYYDGIRAADAIMYL